MENKTIDKIIKILESTNDPDIAKEIDQIRGTDPRDIIRNSILNFFQNRLMQIEEEKDLKNIVIQSIMRKISDNELSIPQLLNLLNNLQNQSQGSIDSILTLFRPTPNANSLIFDFKERTGDTPFSSLKPEESKAIEYLTKVILNQEKTKADLSDE